MLQSGHIILHWTYTSTPVQWASELLAIVDEIENQFEINPNVILVKFP